MARPRAKPISQPIAPAMTTKERNAKEVAWRTDPANPAIAARAKKVAAMRRMNARAKAVREGAGPHKSPVVPREERVAALHARSKEKKKDAKRQSRKRNSKTA